MSYHNRSGKTGAEGTHWQAPLLVSGGPLDDVPRGCVDNAVGPYKVYYEDFKEQMADGAILGDSGWTNTDLNSATSATETVTGANQALFINPGSKADAGTGLQFNAVAVSGADNAAEITTHQILPEFTNTTTQFDGKEIFFQVRMGTVSDSITDNDCKWLMGFFVTDTTPMANGTGVPTIAAGGGFGFHKSETVALGGITGISTNAAVTTVGTALSPAKNEIALGGTASTTINWHTYAARCRVIDADGGTTTGTGVTDFWYDGVHSLRLATVPFDATDEMSFTFACQNGPTQVADFHIDYILTGTTRPGLTWPYTNGVIY